MQEKVITLATPRRLAGIAAPACDYRWRVPGRHLVWHGVLPLAAQIGVALLAFASLIALRLIFKKATTTHGFLSPQ